MSYINSDSPYVYAVVGGPHGALEPVAVPPLLLSNSVFPIIFRCIPAVAKQLSRLHEALGVVEPGDPEEIAVNLGRSQEIASYLDGSHDSFYAVYPGRGQRFLHQDENEYRAAIVQASSVREALAFVVPRCSSASFSTVDYSLWSPSSSAGSSKSRNPVHAASLVNPLVHSSELLQLLNISLLPSIIDYLVNCILQVVDDALARAGVKSPPPSRNKFAAFVSTVLSRAEVTSSTLLVTLTYLDRAAPRLYIWSEKWADERIFLGALICASKYTNDSGLKNAHWAICTGVFGKRDIGRIEREFLQVLDWKLGVTEQNLLPHCEGLMDAAGMRSAVHTATAKPLEITRMPGLQRTPSSASTSSVSSLPSLSPASFRASRLLSPTPSPRTPPLHLTDVAMEVDIGVSVDTTADIRPSAGPPNGRLGAQRHLISLGRAAFEFARMF